FTALFGIASETLRAVSCAFFGRPRSALPCFLSATLSCCSLFFFLKKLGNLYQ
ncbi:unnamed protein product, partial [Musa acuminata subsp. burmannicoides]